MSHSYRLAELAAAHGLELRGDGERIIDRIAPLEQAGPDAISFLAASNHRRFLPETRAGAVILKPEDADACPTAVLLSTDPYASYARIAQQIYPGTRPEPGVNPSAVVGDGCRLGDGVSIGPLAVLGTDCDIGDGTIIGAGCVLGDGVVVGPDSRLVASVTLCTGVRVGARALLQPGAVVGADGFGFANENGAWIRIPQVGGVVLGDDVEVGANTTIDRGALEDTVIGNGVKLDNLVMVAHNVRIGEHTALAGCAGVAGSAVIGARCTVGGGARITGHVEIADEVHIAGNTGVSRSIDTPGGYSSVMPMMETREWRKNAVRIRQLDDLARRLKALERKLEQD